MHNATFSSVEVLNIWMLPFKIHMQYTYYLPSELPKVTLQDQ